MTKKTALYIRQLEITQPSFRAKAIIGKPEAKKKAAQKSKNREALE